MTFSSATTQEYDLNDITDSNALSGPTSTDYVTNVVFRVQSRY